MQLSKLVASGVLFAAIASLLTMWALFFTMWLQGAREITLYVDTFGEFWIELVILTLAIVFLPVLVYEFDGKVLDRDEY